MKIILGIVALLVVSGCGIMSLIFGLPERYIDRDVKTDEMVGVWKITPESQDALNKFVKEYSDWYVSIPWKTIIINSDNTCKVKFETKWQHTSANDVTICSWQLAKDKGLNGKQVPVIELDFKDSDDFVSRYFLYIVEEKGKLIFWNFIGDPDDFITEDFIKIKE